MSTKIYSTEDWINAGYGGDRLVPLPPGEKGPKIAGWQGKSFSRGELTATGDLGLRTRAFPALDVDCDGLGFAQAVHAVLHRRFPDAMLRERNGSARFAAIFRLKPGTVPFRKLSRSYLFTQPGQNDLAFKLELLGDGQQLKVLGPHPDDPSSVFGVRELRAPVELPGLDLDGARALLDVIEAELMATANRAPGGNLVLSKAHDANTAPSASSPASSSQGGSSQGGSLSPRQSVGRLDPDALRELVAAIPNTTQAFPDHDDAVRVVSAIWGASGGGAWGEDIARDWLQSGDWVGANDDAYCAKVWRSFAQAGRGTTLGGDYLHALARETGGASGRSASARTTWRARGADDPDSIENVLAAQGHEVEAPAAMRANRVRAAAAKGPGCAGSGGGAGGGAGGSGEEPAAIAGRALRDPGGVAADWPVAGRIKAPGQADSFEGWLGTLYYRSDTGTVCDRLTDTPQGGRGWYNAADAWAYRWANDPALEYEVPAKKAGDPPTVKRTPLAEAMKNSPLVPHVDTVGYFPGAPEFYRSETGQLVKNTWQAVPEVAAAVRKITPARLAWAQAEIEAGRRAGDAIERSPLGQWIFALCEGTGERDWRWSAGHLLDWIALVVCCPSVKPGHHPFLAGEPGLGKSLLAAVLSALVGEANRSTVAMHSLTTAFNDGFRGKLCVVDEMALLSVSRNVASVGRQVMNNLKMYMTAEPRVVPINRKMLPVEHMQNLAGWMLLSNYPSDQLGLDPDDRRIWVLDTLNGMTGAIRARCRSAASGLWGSRAQHGFGPGWRRVHAEALADRFAAMIVENGGERLRAVLGDAPLTVAKVTTAASDEGLGPLGAFIRDLWHEGLLPDVLTGEEVRRVGLNQRIVPVQVAAGLGDARAVSQALRELGAVGSMGGSKHSWPKRTVFIMPGASSGHPGPVGDDATTRDLEAHRDAVRDWRDEQEARSGLDLRAAWAAARGFDPETDGADGTGAG